MPGRYKLHPLGKAVLGIFALAAPFTTSAASHADVIKGWQTVHSDRPSIVGDGTAKVISELDTFRPISVTVTLPLTNKSDLDRFVEDVSIPGNAAYGHYLTPTEFAARYGASQANYNAVIAWARDNGLTVTQTSISRNTISLSGTTGQIGRAFSVKFRTYVDTKGASFFSASTEPKMPSAIAAGVQAVYGISDHALGHPMDMILTPAQRAAGRAAAKLTNGQPMFATTEGEGTGHHGDFGAQDLNTLYQMPDLNNGKGQAIGCFEQGGYFNSDPITYRNYYNLPKTPIINRSVAGTDTSVPIGGVATEAALDIDMEMALAPHAKGIYVYEAGTETNFISSLMDSLSAVADDDKISAFDISYGIDELFQLSDAGYDGLADEQDAFKRCAAEGISVYVSSGDTGAYGDLGEDFYPASYNVSDPASQPYVTSVGGTTIFTYGKYDYAETAWNNLGYTGGATGGGVSDLWKLPSYQKFSDGTPLTNFNGGSGKYRNVPDVAAVADPLTSVDVYSSERDEHTFEPYGWIGVGGTSASAPIWTGFTALVNQERADAGLPALGFANPLLYGVYKADLGFDGSGPTLDFDDVFDNTNGNTSLFGSPGYSSGGGYDNTTGLGSLSGKVLLKNLVASYTSIYSSNPGSPATPTGFVNTVLTPTSATFTWNAAKNATGYIVTLDAQDTYYQGGLKLPVIATSTIHTTGTVVHLQPNTGYLFELVAVNKNGSQLDPTDLLSITTPAE